MKYLIRNGTKENSLIVSHVITLAWNETYKGIVQNWFLQELFYDGEKYYYLTEELLNIHMNYINENKKSK